METDRHAVMNTGLLTPNGEEIFGLFVPNNTEGRQKWFLEGFYKTSDHNIPPYLRDSLPPHVDYFADNPEDMYFDPKCRILINVDHILQDHFDRLPEELQKYDIDVLRILFMSAEKTMQLRISRNNRLVVPQYYHGKIMYLAPFKIGKSTIPLAIEKFENTYRVNTVFTHGMAYCAARLIMRPETHWLCNDTRSIRPEPEPEPVIRPKHTEPDPEFEVEFE